MGGGCGGHGFFSPFFLLAFLFTTETETQSADEDGTRRTSASDSTELAEVSVEPHEEHEDHEVWNHDDTTARRGEWPRIYTDGHGCVPYGGGCASFVRTPRCEKGGKLRWGRGVRGEIIFGKWGVEGRMRARPYEEKFTTNSSSGIIGSSLQMPSLMLNSRLHLRVGRLHAVQFRQRQSAKGRPIASLPIATDNSHSAGDSIAWPYLVL